MICGLENVIEFRCHSVDWHIEFPKKPPENSESDVAFNQCKLTLNRIFHQLLLQDCHDTGKTEFGCSFFQSQEI